MDAEKGRKIYMAAMARGGGSNRKQARELMRLSDEDLACSITFKVFAPISSIVY